MEKYSATIRRRAYMPATISGRDRITIAETLEQLVLDKRRATTTTPVYCDIFTDQIDVRVGRELIAVYMID